jgi:hypothetical protein
VVLKVRASGTSFSGEEAVGVEAEEGVEVEAVEVRAEGLLSNRLS